MKKIILFIASVTILYGCVTEKHRARICKTCPASVVRKDSIAYVHDTVKINLPGRPGPTVYLDNPCKFLCDSLGNLKKVNITEQKNGQILNINTLGGGMNITSETKDTTAKAPYVKENHYSREVGTVVKWLSCENERTPFDGFCRWFTYIVGFPAALYAIFWLIKKFVFKK